jgi:Zinc-finger of C2H2 type
MAKCRFLIEYCTNFVRRNLDGVLNVGKKSEMNQYLEDMLADTTYRSGKRYRDDHHHPFVFDVLTAGNNGRPNFHREWFSNIDEWAQGCKQLFKSCVVQGLLALAEAREYDENVSSLNGKPRRSGSFHEEHEQLKQRARALIGRNELSEANVAPKRKESTLDHCIRKTANMDLSSTRLANEQSEWLAKEIRGVRKKLKQISHLQELSEVRLVVLSTEQRAKVDRRATLEAELSVYESAMEEVERRILELKRRDGQELASGAGSDIDQERFKATPSRVTFADDDMNQTMKETIATPVASKEEVKFFCDLCQVKCSDKSNLMLHQNGRRHRNRVVQVEEQEKKLAAKSIHEQKRAAQFKASQTDTKFTEIAPRLAWGMSSSQPIYRLPPPPHPVIAQVNPETPLSCKQKGSFIETPSRQNPTSNFVQILKEQQEAAKLSPSKVEHQTMTSAIWDSSPGSTRCVPLSLYNAPRLISVPVESQGERRTSVSLSDFLNPSTLRKSTTSVSATSVSHGKSDPPVAPWSRPQAEKVSTVKSIMQIQAEEADLRARQDKSYASGGGSWFVERRQRADSLVEIQKHAEMDLEHRLLVEQQLRIESQIQEEIRRQRDENGRQNGKGGRKRSNKSSLSRSRKCNAGASSSAKSASDDSNPAISNKIQASIKESVCK